MKKAEWSYLTAADIDSVSGRLARDVLGTLGIEVIIRSVVGEATGVVNSRGTSTKAGAAKRASRRSGTRSPSGSAVAYRTAPSASLAEGQVCWA